MILQSMGGRSDSFSETSDEEYCYSATCAVGQGTSKWTAMQGPTATDIPCQWKRRGGSVGHSTGELSHRGLPGTGVRAERLHGKGVQTSGSRQTSRGGWRSTSVVGARRFWGRGSGRWPRSLVVLHTTWSPGSGTRRWRRCAGRGFGGCRGGFSTVSQIGYGWKIRLET